SAGLAILADAGRPFRNLLRPVLQDYGFTVETVEDGTAAFKMAVARQPALLVASVHLAGLSGVGICEGVKQSPHLKGITVALMGTPDTADLFNSGTASAYGADLFLDETMSAVEMAEEVGTIFEKPAGGGTSTEVEDEIDFTPALDGLAAGGTPPGSPRDEIRRLARIMLADLRLYNPDRFRAALDEGRLLEVFKVEITRGRDIIDQRFPDMAGRQEHLAAALRDAIDAERGAHARG
ncbi:MAG TPA: hypothetical protein VJV75_03655, partial [Candidatus Polarisedimenticolia bacterium]|nr:hypothetical protein [Candidatus Polarisedimenticolia bacterium]